MKKGIAQLILFFFPVVVFSQSPDWGTLTALDKAEYIVTGKMQVENLKEGLGIIKITRVIKGEEKITKVKVQFSDRQERKQNTKQEEPPTYWYANGQEGMWILTHKNASGRYELRQANVYYETKWEKWIEEKLVLLNNRSWTENVNGMSGSVIIDSLGANKFYRFFYLCLKNNSDSTLYINTHYRIREKPQQRIQATITTPSGTNLDMMEIESYCHLGGEPGWPEPLKSDFVAVPPGKTVYLVASGILNCFLRDKEKGTWHFQSVFYNEGEVAGIKGTAWKGKIVFPQVSFEY